MVGYEGWLREVWRVLVPGGYFVFTFTSKNGGISDDEEWDAAVDQVGFACKRVKRVTLVCHKQRGG